MEVLNLAAVLIVVSAGLAYVNERFIHLPSAIGLMLIALGMSLAIVVVGSLGLGGMEAWARYILAKIDFNDALMHGMLSFLLFAGALHVNLGDLASRGWTISSLATVGVALSTFLVGGGSWLLFGWMGLEVPLLYCLVFGALISPTDPIAVMGILKTAGAPHALSTTIVGESLFNDGIAVVLFVVLLSLAGGEATLSSGEIGLLFVEEAGGGMALGLVAGGLAYYMIKTVNSYQVAVLITLALVMGGYLLATLLHVSGPIAMVVAGLLIGNHGRLLAMSADTRHYLDIFWEVIDEILNTVLFVLIGLEVLVLSFRVEYLVAAVVAIPLVLFARFFAVGLLVGALRSLRSFTPGVVKIVTWGGIRGGVSVALALSLPEGPQRELILVIAYCVVVFSILVQGLTLGGLVKWMARREGIR